MLKNVKCAKCVKCGKEYPATPDVTTCECGGILDIVYDYDYIKSRLTKEKLAARKDMTMWRYRELLPIEEETENTPLRVGNTPLYEEPRLAEMLGLGHLYVKDDGLNPTSSLKDRASAMAVAKAKEAGKDIIACSSTGNAASSLAGNAAAAGMKTYIFVPSRAPKGKVAQLLTFGATVVSVQGNYEETFELSSKAIDRWGWYNRNAAVNPYLSEGKKTVSLEICEQLQWKAPDYIAVAVGDGASDRLHLAVSVSHVTFADLTQAQIEAYITTDEPYDKAGGYAVQGLAGLFIERIEGSYSGIMGLPVFETAKLLAQVAPDLLPACAAR